MAQPGDPSLLSYLDEEQLGRISGQIETKSYERGQSVVLRGEVLTAVYLLKAGAALARPKAARLPVPIEAGELFGETAVLDDPVSQLSITASESGTVVLAIRAWSFKRLLEGDPALERRLLDLADRRRAAISASPPCS